MCVSLICDTGCVPTVFSKLKCVISEVETLSNLIYDMKCTVTVLEEYIQVAKELKDFNEKANYIKDAIVLSMRNLRKIVDKIETKVDGKDWPMPTYVDLLFGL